MTRYGRDAWSKGLIAVCSLVSALLVGGLASMWMVIEIPTDPRGWYYLALAHIAVAGWLALTILIWGIT